MFNEQQLNQLYQYAYSLSKDKDDAYDLVYGSLERYLQQKQPKHEAMAYIKRSIKNAFIDHLKSSRHQKEVYIEDSINGDDQPHGTPSFDNLVAIKTHCLEETLINEQQVAVFTEQLNSEENELLYYWAVEGYTVQEISEETGKPKGTLLSKLHRIRKKAEQFTARMKNYHTGSAS